MKSGIKIGIGIAIPIIIPIIIIVALFSMNAYAITNLQFRGHSVDDVDLIDMNMDTKFEVCNPTFFPASFETLKVDVVYKSTNFGTITMWGQAIPSNTPTILDGRVNMDGQAITQLFVAPLDSTFRAGEIDFDPKQVKIFIELDAPILGIIPFTVTKSYPSDEFVEIFQGKINEWSCGGTALNNFLAEIPFMSGFQEPSLKKSDG